ncbi:ROK family protein [[Clostridium] sordellii]|nr:ROK family protein [[Clostridium] sordellii] [Paeniclostridium sordellii]
MLSIYLGIDIGGTSIKYGTYNEYGEELIKGSKYIKTPKYDLGKIVKIIDSIVNEFKELDGIGLSIPGCINPESGYIQDGGSIRALDKVNIKELLKRELKIDVEVENDANCALLAEKWIGNAKESSNFICITLGTGVGGALYINDKLVSGNNNFAGEFGYMIVDNIYDRYKVKTLNRDSSTITFIRQVASKKGIYYKALDGISIFNLIKSKDEDAVDAYRKWIRRIAICIYNLGFIIDPEKVLIGGGVSEESIFISDIKLELNKLSVELIKENGKLENLSSKWNVIPCKYLNDSGKIGAVYNYMSRN